MAMKIRRQHTCNSLGMDSVEECGLYLDSTWTLGASVAEVECLYTQRNNAIDVDLGNKGFALSCDGGQITLKKNHDYVQQVQGQLYLSNHNTCTMAFWTPANMVLLPITKDPLWEGNLAVLRKFYQQLLLPKKCVRVRVCVCACVFVCLCYVLACVRACV